VAGSVSCKIDLSQFTAALRATGQRVDKVLKSAAQAMAPPVIEEVQALLKQLPPDAGWQHTGLTAKSIAVVKTRSTRGKASVKIGSKSQVYVLNQRGTRLVRISARTLKATGGKAKFNPQKILHLLELGTRAHPVGTRQHPGARAFHVLARAVARRQAQARERAAAVLRNAIAG